MGNSVGNNYLGEQWREGQFVEMITGAVCVCVCVCTQVITKLPHFFLLDAATRRTTQYLYNVSLTCIMVPRRAFSYCRGRVRDGGRL